MQKETRTSILHEYDSSVALYDAFGATLAKLVGDLLKEHGVKVHSVEFRRKARDRLARKLNKEGASYASLGEITDVCGLRVITYFDDDVQSVAALVGDHFCIDVANSPDIPKRLAADRFGYLSVHRVVSNHESRRGLVEYKRFNGIKAEIQIRSILQHAWAEIEHDLGYKSEAGIPNEVRRQFSRVAGLLELADQEFRSVRDKLAVYSGEVSAQIENAPSEVSLDAVSVDAYIKKSAVVERIDRHVVEVARGRLEDPSTEFVTRQVVRLNSFGIHSISDLGDKLSAYERTVMAFSTRWVSYDDGPNVPELESYPRGVAIFYLCYVLAFVTNQVESYLRESSLLDGGDDALLKRLNEIMSDLVLDGTLVV